MIRFFFLADAALVALHLLSRAWTTRPPIVGFFLDLDNDWSVPSWYSAMQLAFVGCLLVILARVAPTRMDRVRVAFVAALFFFLSKEECFGIHEFVMRRLARHGDPQAQAASFFRHSTTWPILLGPPLLVAMLVLGWRLEALVRGRPGVIRKGIAGAACFLGGAVGVELLLNLIPLGGTAHLVEVVAEESLEMVGVTFFVWASYELLRGYGVRLIAERAGDPETAGDLPAPRPAASAA